jgi:hypothetical protein
VTFVASWLRYAVAEARAEFDGIAIREAARRAVSLWPDAPAGDPNVGWRSQTMIAGIPGEPGAGPG